MAGVQRKDLKTISEFTVDRDKINLIEKYKEKIERLYEVEVKFDYVNETESKQWIIVEGENIDRMSAKEYMLALCDPQESQVFQINCDALDEDMLEQIEKQTNAVLQSLSDYRIEIRGTELAVILAMSSLEDVLGKHESVVDVDGATQQAEGNKQTTNNDYTNNEPSHWSRQLDTSLRRALSQNGDFNCSVDDYNSASTSVKQVILSCMNHRYSDDEDMDDNVLFAGHSEISDGASSSRKYKVPIFVDGRQINRSPVKDLIAEAEESPSSSNVTSLSDQFNQTIISPEKHVSSPKPTIKKKDTPDQQYLRQFGLSVGYSEEEVEEGLEFVDEKTKPADFLELLSDIKSNKESNSGDEVNDSCLIVSSSFPAPPKIDLSQKQDGARRSLPDEYKQRLIKDFSEEHEHLSVAELKRRNEERQKMLQEAFENKQSQNSGGKGKKRKNKNKNKNKNRLNSPSGRNQSKQTKGQTQNQQKGKQTPGDGQNTENHDDEETCVLRTWEDDDGDNCSDNDCTIVGHDGPTVPTVYANYTVGQNQVALPNEQPWQQQSSPSRHTWQQVPSKNQPRQQMQPNPLQPWKQQQQQSPRQQQFRQDRGPPPGIMPLMEVDVNPALMGAGRDDLRYIVVDGSNVAMTHGNGKCYSCKGIKIVIDYFIQRGHKDITAFVPLWRTYKPRPEYPISDQNILNELKESGHLVFTPSRRLSKKFINSYDDRFVLQLAEKEDGIIVSNDQYRDLMQEKSSWRKIIEEKLLMYTFVKDNFMPPNDPLGRDGPCLDEYLRKSPRQSLRKRHLSPSNNQDTPNTWKHRDQRSSNDQRWTRPQQHYNQPQQNMINYPQNNYPVGFHPVNIPPPNYPYHHQQQQQPRNEVDSGYKGHNPQQNRSAQKNVKLRSEQQTKELFKQLKVIFSEPDQVKKINEILQNHPAETNMEKLTNFCINAFC